MGAQEKGNVVKELIEQESQGAFDHQEINDALEEMDFDVEQVDRLYEHAGKL